MSEIVVDPPVPSCYLLFSGPGIEESQSVDPDPFLPRDARGRFARRSSGNPAGRPRGIPNPKRREPDLAARPLSAGAVGSHRPQAATVAAPRRATLAAAARSHRPGGASRDRPVVVADVRGSSASAVRRAGGRCARRDRTRRGRAYRGAGGCPAARGPPPRTNGAAGRRMKPVRFGPRADRMPSPGRLFRGAAPVREPLLLAGDATSSQSWGISSISAPAHAACWPEQQANYQGANYGWQRYLAALERMAAKLD